MKMPKKRYSIPLYITILLFAVYQFYFPWTYFNHARYGEMYEMFQIQEYIYNYYVDKIDRKTCVEKILKAGLEACLDKNSYYSTKEEVPELKEQIAGSFGGVGIEIDKKGDYIQVVALIDGTPAAIAGIMPGDVIVAVDGATTRGMDLTNFVKKVKGKPGTSVTLTVQRWQEKPKDVLLVREIIRVASVKYSYIVPRIGYTRITQFTEKTAYTLAQAVSKLKILDEVAYGKSIDGIVIDLRGNPGGFLDEVFVSLDLFRPKNTKLMIVEKGAHWNEKLEAAGIDGSGGPFAGIPVMVLINGGSASASEIMAGTFKLWGHMVVGEKSHGKGTVQRALLPLFSGAALNLTVARYYLGEEMVSVDGIGVSPDFEVKWKKVQGQSDEYFAKEYRANFGNPASDPQLKKAIEVLQEQMKKPRK